MKPFRVAVAVCLATLLAATSASATCWEIGLKVQNDSGQYMSTPVTVAAMGCGGTVWSGSSTSTPGSDGVNFRIDLNSNCPGMPQLTPGVQYVVKFPSWGNKAFYLEGVLIPGEPIDDIFTVRPSSLTWTSGAHVQELWGYPTATTGPCLTLALDIVQTTYVGDKTTYKLRATASGGSSYSFAWSNVSAVLSGATVNPNFANRTVLRSQTVTVTCTVNGTVSKSILLEGGLVPKDEPRSWSAIKAWFRD